MVEKVGKKTDKKRERKEIEIELIGVGGGGCNFFI